MSGSETQITRVSGIALDPDGGEECLVQIYGERLGHKYDLQDSILVGRGEECDIVLQTDSVSRKHCLFEHAGGGVRLKDLESTNGTHVNDVAVSQTQLRHGDLVKIGDTIFKYLAAGNVERAYHEEIYKMTIMDGLTGVHNRRYIQEFLEREVARAIRHGRPLSFVLFDLDKFKDVNDNFGHLTGDYVLSQTADLVRGRIRKEEVFGRYGGEEFCAILPETPLSGGIDFAEWFRKTVESHTFTFDGDHIPVTLSAGVSSMGPSIEDWATLIERADASLYRAKKSGRNRVVGDEVG